LFWSEARKKRPENSVAKREERTGPETLAPARGKGGNADKGIGLATEKNKEKDCGAGS